MCQDKGTTVPSPGELLERLMGGIDDSPDNLRLPPMRPVLIPQVWKGTHDEGTAMYDPLDPEHYWPAVEAFEAEIEGSMPPLASEFAPDGYCRFCGGYQCVCEDSYGAYDDGGPWEPLDNPVEDLDALAWAAMEEWPWPEDYDYPVDEEHQSPNEAGFVAGGLLFVEAPEVVLADRLIPCLPQRNPWAEAWEE